MLTSLIRTVVPWLVALVGPWLLVHAGVSAADLSAVATILLGAVYYFVARLLEQWHPGWGYLLGVPVQPAYVPSQRRPSE